MFDRTSMMIDLLYDTIKFGFEIYFDQYKNIEEISEWIYLEEEDFN
jgi:hypothetical protein